MINIRINSTDKQVGTKAGCLLDIHAEPSIPIFLVGNSAMILYQDGEEQTAIDLDLSKPFEVSIYPNPSTGLVTFDFPNVKAGDLLIEIIDLTGKTVHTEQWSDTNGQRIDLGHLHKGMYVVKILIDGNHIESQKLKLQ